VSDSPYADGAGAALTLRGTGQDRSCSGQHSLRAVFALVGVVPLQHPAPDDLVRGAVISFRAHFACPEMKHLIARLDKAVDPCR
jgi:hypothetical protein